MRLARVRAIAWKEWREILRDRLFFTMAFVVPLLIMLVLGYGLSLDVENIPFAVVDHDRSEASRAYIQRFSGSRYFDFVGYVERDADLQPLLADSRIRLGLVIPARFERRLRGDRPVEVQALIDGMFPFRAQTTKGYLEAIDAEANRELLGDFLKRRKGLTVSRAARVVAPVRLAQRYLYNQAIESRWSIGSGLMMLVLMVSPPFLTALGVVREKESGSIYNIFASTVTRGEFILGKLLPYVGVSCLNILLLWLIATQLFGAPFKGDPLFFFLASLVYVVCTAGIGLLVSILVTTQVAAVLLTTVVTFIPAMLYSGLLVPVESMSADARMQAYLFPPRYFLEIVWGSFLKGLGWTDLWVPVAVLAGYAALLWSIGLLAFHKRPRR